MTLLAGEISAIVQWLAHSLVLPFLGIGIKIDLFQYCGPWWVFQICWHMECNTLMESFRVLNSYTGIPSYPLALLTAVLPLALTLQNVWVWVADNTIVVIQFIKIFFCTVLCILSLSSWSLQHLLDLHSFCPLLCLSFGEIFPWHLQFSWRDL